jgi:hypothetical protein
MACTCGEEAKIVQLAEYRRKLAPDDDGHPPPSPRPAAARRPVPLVSTDVFGRTYSPGRCVGAGALISRPPTSALQAKAPVVTSEISPSTRGRASGILEEESTQNFCFFGSGARSQRTAHAAYCCRRIKSRADALANLPSRQGGSGAAVARVLMFSQTARLRPSRRGSRKQRHRTA